MFTLNNLDSLINITIALLLLIFSNTFIQISIKLLNHCYLRTGLKVFKFQADNMDSVYVRMVIVLVSIILLGFGFLELFR